MRMIPATLLAAASFLLAAAPAWAAGSTASGSSALALAALVAQQSPTLSAPEKHALAGFFAGNPKTPYAGKTITVTADKIVCKAGNVDITLHQCDLTFGAKTVTLTGEKAHELYATILEVGVPPDGAAGTTYEALSQLSCTIDPAQIRAEAGGGATCTFTPGAS
jgi:hypothetical protein